MTPRQRAIAALELKQPDDIVPTFELEFHLAAELLGCDFQPIDNLSGRELEHAIAENAALHVKIAERLDYSILRTTDIRILRRWVRMGVNRTYLLCGEADGTMAIPGSETMLWFCVALAESPATMHIGLEHNAQRAMEWGREQIEAGADVLTMCSDYCFNKGPFLSPQMFAEFVAPYLSRIIASHRLHGAYVIKHTDGNIMPILDQIVACGPHALHALDPRSGVDIAQVKKLVGNRVCLCGNVDGYVLQTGTDDDVRHSAFHALAHGMPGGGFIYGTSNVVFKGIPLERYLSILEMRQQYGHYRPYGSDSRRANKWPMAEASRAPKQHDLNRNQNIFAGGTKREYSSATG